MHCNEQKQNFFAYILCVFRFFSSFYFVTMSDFCFCYCFATTYCMYMCSRVLREVYERCVKRKEIEQKFVCIYFSSFCMILLCISKIDHPVISDKTFIVRKVEISRWFCFFCFALWLRYFVDVIELMFNE